MRDLANKMAMLDREMKYLVNKAKIWRPKPEPVVNTTDKFSENKIKNSNDSNSESLPKSDTEKIEESDAVPENKSDSGDSQAEKLILESGDSAEEKEKEKEAEHQEL